MSTFPLRALARLSAEDVRSGARLLAGLPRFLRTPFSLDQARTAVKDRFARRAERLVRLVKAVVGDRGSPYAKLLRGAGCDVADVAELVGREGVEGTLGILQRAGVYLTVDELKGRRPVVRGSLRFEFDRAALVNPGSVVHGLAETSGSSGPPSAVPIDLASITDHAVNTHVALAAYGGGEWRHAHYGAPGGTAVTNPLELAKGGHPPDRWFTPIALDAPGLSPRYRLGSAMLRLGSALAGVALPGPTLAPLDDPEPVVVWMIEELARGRIPHVWTFASTAVLVCQAALDTGRDLHGARFTAGGEPTTAARRAAIERAGAVALPRMGTTETDILSYACAHPVAPDDMHFFEDRVAVIQPAERVARSGQPSSSSAPGSPAALPPAALLLTTLLPSAPLLLLNVSLGDQARLERRSCGCPLEREGWTLHIEQVRSFEKLTAGGVALLDVDIDRVLEQVLPARFGGRPTDYQLIERLDGAKGRPDVTLVIHPRVGAVREEDVIAAFFDAIGGNGSGGERMMTLQWRDCGLPKVARQAPRLTPAGKILHLHHEDAGMAVESTD